MREFDDEFNDDFSDFQASESTVKKRHEAVRTSRACAIDAMNITLQSFEDSLSKETLIAARMASNIAFSRCVLRILKNAEGIDEKEVIALSFRIEAAFDISQNELGKLLKS